MKKERKRTLPEETIKVLNVALEAAEVDAKATKISLAAAENAYYRERRKVTNVDGDIDALMGAIRALADQVTSKTSPGRRARHEARELLAARKIPPPSTLGAPRNRPKVRKKRRT